MALPGEDSAWPSDPVGPANSMPFNMPKHYAEMLYRAQMHVVRFRRQDREEWRRWWGEEDVRCPPLIFKSGKDEPIVLAAFYFYGVQEEFQFISERTMRCANCETGIHPAPLCPLPALCHRCERFGHVEFYPDGTVMCPLGGGGGVAEGG